VRALWLALAAAALPAQQKLPPVRGFPPELLAQQRQLEDKARAIPDGGRARAYMKKMAAVPHHAGSPGSKAVAEYALGLFKQWGFDARIEEFEALLPFPTARVVEMTAPVQFRAKLSEPVMAEDPDSGDAGQLPLYNAYSASGDVSGPLLYVNYGIPADYARLEQMGIAAKGKIVIARYGKSWRGTKAKTAYEQGALACIIYSDPRDDGFWQGDVFPEGPFRPSASAQRGSVMDMPLYVGDPLSPGWASVKGSRRIDRAEAATLMKIPVLPLSYADAQPLLERLGGPVAPEDWRGALPVTYHVGPGDAVVRVKTDFDWTSKPVYNVVATLTGSTQPEEWVIYGNHHDAWVNGAADPVSGAVALLETARAAAELHRTGWRPRRTLKFALWDAEEFGLIGSTEWAEQHAVELASKTVAYLNSDMNTHGGLSTGGSPLLEEFLRQVMRDVRDPSTAETLLAVREKDRKLRVSPPGAGSDYVAFLHHLGIPVLNLGFNAPGSQGTYHSIYDSYAWFTKHMDRDFRYSRGFAQLMATAVLRLSEAVILPHDLSSLHRSLAAYAEELKKAHPKLNLSPVTARIDDLKDRSRQFAEAYEQALPKAAGSPQLRALNQKLTATERMLTRAAGLPGRPWYKHQIYAPGMYTGYSAHTFPGMREAADQGRMTEAREQIQVLADTLRSFNEHADQVITLLNQI